MTVHWRGTEAKLRPIIPERFSHRDANL